MIDSMTGVKELKEKLGLELKLDKLPHVNESLTLNTYAKLLSCNENFPFGIGRGVGCDLRGGMKK